MGVSIALVSFAAGSFVSEGADGLRAAWSDPASEQAQVVAAVAAPDVEVHVLTETTEQPIPYGSSTTVDTGAKQGSQRVVQVGANGVELVSYTVTLVNGVEKERVPGLSVVMLAPVDEIIAIGALKIPQTTPAEQGSNRALGERLANELYGWTGDEWYCLDNLWARESGWRHTAENTSSGAYGIPQALPGDKMAVYGADWRTNPEPQIKWGLGYVAGRYGTPCGAWSFFLQKNWY